MALTSVLYVKTSKSYFPLDDTGLIYGGTVAAPAFERIMEFALPYLKIPPG